MVITAGGTGPATILQESEYEGSATGALFHCTEVASGARSLDGDGNLWFDLSQPGAHVRDFILPVCQ